MIQSAYVYLGSSPINLDNSNQGGGGSNSGGGGSNSGGGSGGQETTTYDLLTISYDGTSYVSQTQNVSLSQYVKGKAIVVNLLNSVSLAASVLSTINSYLATDASSLTFIAPQDLVVAQNQNLSFSLPVKFTGTNFVLHGNVESTENFFADITSGIRGKVF